MCDSKFVVTLAVTPCYHALSTYFQHITPHYDSVTTKMQRFKLYEAKPKTTVRCNQSDRSFLFN